MKRRGQQPPSLSGQQLPSSSGLTPRGQFNYRLRIAPTVAPRIWLPGLQPSKKALSSGSGSCKAWRLWRSDALEDGDIPFDAGGEPAVAVLP